MDGVLVIEAACAQYGTQIIENLAGLLFYLAPNHFPGFRMQGDLARAIQHTARQDTLAVWPYRRRSVRGFYRIAPGRRGDVHNEKRKSTGSIGCIVTEGFGGRQAKIPLEEIER